MCKQLFSLGFLGVVLSSAAGCEAGLNADDPASSTQAVSPQQGWTRVEPSITADVQAGRSRDVIVMLADEHPEKGIHGPAHYGGAPMTIMLYTTDCDDTYKKAIAAGSKSLREPTDQFYGDRMAGVEDPFGFQWYIATHVKDVSEEEMKAAMAGQAS